MWRLLELGEPIKNGREVIWRWKLEFANGWSASTVGHGFYHDANPNASYGDALETCKSDALVRAVKDLGFGTELLKREWKEGWKLANCRLVWCTNKGELKWRRNDALPFEDEGDPERSLSPTYQRKVDYYDQAREHWAELTSKLPDLVRAERAEKEQWTHGAADPWDELTENQQQAEMDAFFADDARED